MKQTHAIARAQERYGITLTTNDLWELVQRIKRDEAMLIAHQADGTQVWAIKVGEKIVRLIYDPKREHIVTFLPLNVPLSKHRMNGGKPPRKVRRQIKSRKRKAA